MNKLFIQGGSSQTLPDSAQLIPQHSHFQCPEHCCFIRHMVLAEARLELDGETVKGSSRPFSTLHSLRIQPAPWTDAATGQLLRPMAASPVYIGDICLLHHRSSPFTPFSVSLGLGAGSWNPKFLNSSFAIKLLANPGDTISSDFPIEILLILYLPIHAAREIVLGHEPAFVLVRPAEFLHALKVLHHDGFAFPCRTVRRPLE